MKQYDKDGALITPRDLQAKTAWCKEGEKIEKAFVDKYGCRLKLSINPRKLVNPFIPDLVSDDCLADLKTQNTPFFKADELYGLDPNYAVVFNRKDAVRYWKKYRHIDIYFWVEWHSVKLEMGNTVREVEPLNGVWKIKFTDLMLILKESKEHFYGQRTHDENGNAKSSFIFDVRQLERVV